MLLYSVLDLYFRAKDSTMRILFLAAVLFVFTGCNQPVSEETVSEMETVDSSVVDAPPAVPVDFDFPTPDSLLSDYYGLLNPVQADSLDSLLTAFETETGLPMRIAVIADLGPYPDFATYSTELYNNWHQHLHWANEGVLIAVCHPCSEVHIRTGRKTDIKLTENRCQQVIDLQIVPYFKDLEFCRGLFIGAQQLMHAWTK